MTLTRVAMRTRMRASAVELLEGWAADPDSGLEPGELSIYPTFPTSIRTPHAFVERVSSAHLDAGLTNDKRLVTVTVLVLWRTFLDGERGDAVEQLDAFLDGFTEYVGRIDQWHQPGPTELIRITRIEEDPTYVLRGRGGDQTFFAGRIALEGFTGN